MDIGLTKAVDEAAVKLEPELKAAITQLVSELEAALGRLLDGRVITIQIGGKKDEPANPAPGQ